MTIDKSWIKLRDRRSSEYLKGLRNFIEIAKNHVDEEGKVSCPCIDCVNAYPQLLTTVYAHIHDRGFQRSYETWTHHGEEYPASDLDNLWAPRKRTTRHEMFDAIDDVVAEQDTNEENIDEETTEETTGLDPEFDELFEEANTELFPGCSWMSALNFLAKLMHIKVINKWTDSSFDQLLEFLRVSYPESRIPASHYEAKKKLRKIGLGYKSIHACINDCALFWKENESMQNCPVCKESRWVDKNTKGKKVPQKVLRYFPLTSRLRRRYGSRFTAKDMVWHHTGSSKDGKMLGVEADCATSYRRRKHGLKKHFDGLEGYKDVDTAKKCPPPRQKAKAWGKVIDKLFTTEKFIHRSQENKGNRKKHLYTSSHGSESLAQKRFKEVEETGKAKHIEGWKKNHFKDNAWVNDRAEEDWAKIQKVYKKMVEEAGGDESAVDEVKCLKQALGERRGFIRGVGRKLKHVSSYHAPSTSTSNANFNAMAQQLTQQLSQQFQQFQQTMMSQNSTVQPIPPFQFRFDPLQVQVPNNSVNEEDSSDEEEYSSDEEESESDD